MSVFLNKPSVGEGPVIGNPCGRRKTIVAAKLAGPIPFLIGILVSGSLLSPSLFAAPPRYATYFTRASCRAEGNSGVMASGAPLDDRAFVCALPHRRFGGWYRVCRADRPSVCTRVQHLDYGPGRGSRSRGIVIDLSAAAFSELAPLHVGKLAVTVEPR